jgi:erythromycin esterase
MPRHRLRRPAIALAVAALLTTAAAPAAASMHSSGSPPDRSLIQHLERQAVPAPMSGSGPDLQGLGRLARGATVVGLGEAAHGVAELTRHKSRAAQHLITRHGFRSVVWEDDWTLGIQINDYIHGRRADRDALVAQMSREARTVEVAEFLSWLRGYNRTHRDKVTFVGAEYFATRPLAYDAVRRYVAANAPEQLAALRPLLKLTDPPNDDMGAYLQWFLDEVDDKASYWRAATAIYDLVATLPHHPRDRSYALALQHARQIRSFYTAFSLPMEEVFAYRDARAAENVRWWQEFSRDRVVYWAAAAHITTAREVTISVADAGTSFAPVGSYLDRWYGPRYMTVGYTFDAGAMFVPPAQQATLPPALDGWFEGPLAGVAMPSFFIGFSSRTPSVVRNWLHRPMLTRGIPAAGTTSTMAGGTPREWYDALVHTQQVSASTPLSPPRP